MSLLFFAFLSLTTASSASTPNEAAYRADVEKWRSERIRRLTADDGWLTVIALSWLQEGDNAIGAAPTNRVVLPAGKAPPALGKIRLAGGKAQLEVAPGVEVTHEGKRVRSLDLASDESGKPTVVRHGTLSFYVIKRGERLGVRVKDSANAARKSFHGIESYPVRSAWRLDARFEPYPPGKTIAIPNILGTVSQEPSPGAVVFRVARKEYRLDAVEEQGEEDLFLIFGDRTNGSGTYGAGRFLYAPRPGRDGKTVVDFNRAYNPPCAFTPFATCPLPPPQNRLRIAIPAGEKMGSGLHLPH